MKVWKLKAIIQKTISYLPYPHRVNFLFQKYITKGVNLTDALFEDKIIHCSNHVKFFRKYAPNKKVPTSLEIGTGWYPIVPIGLYLSGGAAIYTIDISSLLSPERLSNTIDKYDEWQKSGRLAQYLPDIDMERFAKLLSLRATVLQRSVTDTLKELNITSIVGDARKIDLPSHSIDLLNSNNTFEHIYPLILRPILVEFRRLLAVDGIMSHQIDMSDHFAHLDKSITIYNFLRFTDAQWSRIDNDIQPQNRTRFPEFIKMLDETGFEVLETMNREGSLAELATVPVADKYKVYTPAELAISHSLIIAKGK